MRIDPDGEGIDDAYAKLFDDAPCGFLSASCDGVIQKANSTFLNWIGLRAGALEGKCRFADLLTLPGRIYFETHLGPMLQMQGYFREVVVDLVRVGKEPLSAIVHAKQWTSDHGHPPLQLYAVFDASQRRLYERELLTARNLSRQAAEAERDARATAERMSRAKDDVLALVSHELRTPLSAILGWTHVLRQKATGDAELTKGLDIIERNARIQTRLVEDLLDMGRVVSGKLRLDVQQVDLAQVVMAAIDTANASAQAKRIRVTQILDPSVLVSGDPARLQQVFWNLLTNAVKFTPKDGAIRVVMQRVDSHVAIRLTDSGQGMAPELIAHIFERFHQSNSGSTRQTEGLGLGLSLVKYLVEMHGGSVTAESEGEGRGSTFIVSLPALAMHSGVDTRAQEVTALFDPDAALNDISLSGLRVLVVDDSADARDAIEQLLSQRGARVAVASTAEEALRAVIDSVPDVLISDIGLPQENGYELIRKIRMLGQDVARVPAIALTAMSRLEDRTQALLAGYQAHLGKPVDARELLVTLGSLVGRLPRR